MRIIDSNTGIEPEIGQLFSNINGMMKIVKVEEGIFSANALFEHQGDDGRVEQFWVPLTVRYLHPAFPFQKVAFIPS